MNREGPRNYVTLPLLVSHSSPSFFTRIDTPFHPLTHNLPFSKSGAERSLIAILNRNRTSNSFESTFYQFSNKKLNRPSFFFPPLIFYIIRRNWFHVLSVFLYSASLYRTVIFFSKYVSIKHPRRWALTLFIFPIKVEIYANVSTVYFNVSSPMGRKDALFCPGKIGRLPGRLFYSPLCGSSKNASGISRSCCVVAQPRRLLACHPWTATIYNTRSRGREGWPSWSSGFLHVGSL